MEKMRSIVGKNTNTAMHIGIGVGIALILSLVLSVVIAALVNNEVINISSIPLCMIPLHAISIFAGSMVSLLLEKGRVAVMAGIICACYLAVLLCINMLFFTDGFSGVLMGALGILCGGALAVLVNLKFSGQKKPRIKLRSR